MAYDDWCAAQLARYLGKEQDYARFMKRSAFYRNLFNSSTTMFQPRDKEGNWILPFDAYKYGANGGNPFTEGNAWQYCWYVPHNVADLIALNGGDKAFCRKLDKFFTDKTTSGEKNDNASGFVGLYAHGNEPSHHVAYLYTLAGQPHRTEQLVNHIKTTLYNTSCSGYAGNDDCGEMSAWYVFSALGFYPVNPCGGEFVIGSPSIDRAVISLPKGRQFVINVQRPKGSGCYVKQVRLNNSVMRSPILTYEQIMNGGELTFVMSDRKQDSLEL